MLNDHEKAEKAKCRERANFVKQNLEELSVFDLVQAQKKEARQSKKDQLTKIVALKKAENDNFFQKYRHFLMHKWDILKFIKQKMLEKKIA